MVKKLWLWVLLVGLGSTLRAADLSLQIVDLQGGAIPGAAIEVRGLAVSKVVETVTTDATGRAVIPATLPSEVRVTATGFDPLVQRIEAGQNGEISLRLRPATLHTSVDVVVRDVSGTGPSVSSALEIDKSGARTVYDAVDRLVPGAYVTRRGVMGFGLGSGNGVLLRGIGGSPTTGLLVVVDGRPDFMGLMGHPIPDFYTLSDVEMLSITVGPASVLYGNGAMGGVIEITPTRPREGRHGTDHRPRFLLHGSASPQARGPDRAGLLQFYGGYRAHERRAREFVVPQSGWDARPRLRLVESLESIGAGPLRTLQRGRPRHGRGAGGGPVVRRGPGRHQRESQQLYRPHLG